MALSSVISWLGRPLNLNGRDPPSGPTDEPIPLAHPMPVADPTPLPDPSRPPMTWSPDRLAITDGLWGEGYQLPGGELETLRLAKPLGLSAATSLLLLGAGDIGAAAVELAQAGHLRTSET